MKRVHVFLAVLSLSFALSLPAQAAITYQASAGACASAATSVTFSATVAAGSNTIMIAGATGLDSPVGTDTVSGITFNGDALTFATGTLINDATDNLQTEIWYRKAPDVTTANVVVSWSGAGLAALCGGVVVLDGVEQTGTPHRTADTDFGNSGTSADISLLSTADDWTVDAIACWFASCADAEDAGQTIRVNPTASSNFTINMSTETAVGNPTAMGFTVGSGDYWTYSGAAFIPAATTGAVPPTFIQLNGTQ